MVTESNRTWLCSVVFLDIVGYSKVPVTRQIEIKEHMNAVLAEALEEVAERDRIVVDSGDGAAMCFLGDPEEALFSAVKARDAFARPSGDRPEYNVRIGINLGPVKVVRDINQRANVLGDGINVAQRVMDFARADQILVSRSFFEVISCLSQEYAELFHYRGVHKDKHVREHEVYEVNLLSEAQTQAVRPSAVPTGPAATTPPPAPAATPAETPPREASTTVPTAPAGTGIDPDTGDPVTAPEGWDQDMLKRVQKALAAHVGPLAKVLVRKAVRVHRDLDGFFGELAGAIADEASRREFLAQVNALHMHPPSERRGSPAGRAASAAPTWSDATLNSLEHHLAVHVGPLARVLVRKASKRAASAEELRQILAEEIPGEKDRREFLRAAIDA